MTLFVSNCSGPISYEDGIHTGGLCVACSVGLCWLLSVPGNLS